MTPAPVRRRRPVRRIVLGVLIVAVLAWGTWAYAVVQTPRVDRAAPVDAVLVLGGLNSPERTQRALDLVQAGLTRTVVISTPRGYGDALAQRTCTSPPAGVDVVCFVPDPSTTRGEARELRKLAGERGWTRVAVVTSPYHVSRSRMIVDRCFAGTTLMLTSDEHISLARWAWNWLYQTAGYAKAEVLRGC